MSEAGVIYGRPDFQDHNFGITQAKKFPPYVFSIRGASALVHKVVGVDCRWWKPHYNKLVYQQRPTMIARTACNYSFFLEGSRTRTCQIPAPDALLCGACHGEERPFGRRGWARKAGITKMSAHVKLGCVVKGY